MFLEMYFGVFSNVCIKLYFPSPQSQWIHFRNIALKATLSDPLSFPELLLKNYPNT